jgi:hypothetical protein
MYSLDVFHFLDDLSVLDLEREWHSKMLGVSQVVLLPPILNKDPVTTELDDEQFTSNLGLSLDGAQ